MGWRDLRKEEKGGVGPRSAREREPGAAASAAGRRSGAITLRHHSDSSEV